VFSSLSVKRVVFQRWQFPAAELIIQRCILPKRRIVRKSHCIRLVQFRLEASPANLQAAGLSSQNFQLATGRDCFPPRRIKLGSIVRCIPPAMLKA